MAGQKRVRPVARWDLRAARFETRHADDITREVASAFDRLLSALRFYALADEPGEE